MKAGAEQDKASNSDDVFNDGDLAAIFDPRRYLLNNSAPDDFWAALIALYTGARLGEIVTLKADVIEVDADSGVLVMNIATAKAGPKAKNANARRRVPLPSAADLTWADGVGRAGSCVGRQGALRTARPTQPGRRTRPSTSAGCSVST